MATFVVNTTSDENDGINVGGISLRDAINAANSAAGEDIIRFDASLSGSSILLNNGELSISEAITIAGLGADLLTIDAQGNSRVFSIDNGNNNADETVALSGLTITGGSVSGRGGGIYNLENLTLNDITVSGNSASRAGGGISSDISTITLNNSTITSNSTANDGGGLYSYNSNIRLNNSTVSGNEAKDGGGLYSVLSTMTLTDSTVGGNEASRRGGGINNADGVLALTNSTVSGNSSNENGGGINNSNARLTLTNTTLSGNSASSGGGLHNAFSSITLTNTTLSGNSANSNGGGLYHSRGTATLTNSTVSGNSASSGGGIYSSTTGVLTVLNLANSLITGNVADNNGDGTGAEIFIKENVGNSVNANGNNLFGQIALTSEQALIGFTPGNLDITATLDGTNPTALDNILDTILQDNGGSTQTHALVAGSPAIDTGDDANLPQDTADLDNDNDTTELIPLDQRDEARLSGTVVDIGAFEVQFQTVALSVSSTTASEADSTTLTLTVTASEAVSDNQTVELSFSGTGVSADDFVETIPSTITIAEGVTRGAITLTIADDSVFEGDETVSFAISNPSGELALGETTTVDVEIVDNDNTVITVDSIGDIDDGDVSAGEVTLREALAAVDDGGTILFSNSLIGETITLAGSELAIAKGVTIDGDVDGDGIGDITVDAQGNSRVFNINDGDETADETVSLSGLTITGGNTDDDGGGIYNRENLILTNSTISDNVAPLGGGVSSVDATATVTNTTVSNNSAFTGGGIHNDNSLVTLTNTTVSGNSALSGGGGVFNDGSTLTLVNSTLSDNLANSNGGGISNSNNSTLELTNSLLSGNDADADGNSSGIGDEIFNDGSTVTADGNNLFGDSSQTSAEAFEGFNPDTDGTSDLIATSDGNLDGGITIDAILDTTLKDNGGPTQTHALVLDSPALDAGNNAAVINLSESDLGIDLTGDDDTNDILTTVNDLAFDQRGEDFIRLVNNNIDIGAYEAADDEFVDLVATAFDVTNDHVLSGEASITFSLINNSSQTDAGAFEISFVYSEDATIDIAGGDEIIGTFLVDELAAGDTLTDSITLTLPTDMLYTNALADDLTGQGSGYVSSSVEYVGMVIDYANDIAESNEGNNRNQGLRTDFDDVTYFPWDIDGNGTITPTDTIYVINRLGTSSTDTLNTYDPLADFDGNGTITPTDVISVINRLGYSTNSSVFESLI